MMTRDQVANMVRVLVHLGAPARIVMFAPPASGNTTPDADVALVVVERPSVSRRETTVRLRHAVARMKMPVELLVMSSEALGAWRDGPATVLYDADLAATHPAAA
jgi:hypothetical protein